MRKSMIAVLIVILFILMLTGCGTQTGKISVTYEQVAESQSPILTPMTDPVTYAIEGLTVVREQNGRKTVIYDVTEQFPENYNCGLDNLVIERDALYFSEGGQPKDTDSYSFVPVRTDLDGSKRIVLSSGGGEYMQIMPYGIRLYFVEDFMSDLEIGWANMDGSGSGPLDIPIAATADGEKQYLVQATLYVEDYMLYADIGLSSDLQFAEVTEEYTVRINNDLTIERVDG